MSPTLKEKKEKGIGANTQRKCSIIECIEPVIGMYGVAIHIGEERLYLHSLIHFTSARDGPIIQELMETLIQKQSLLKEKLPPPTIKCSWPLCHTLASSFILLTSAKEGQIQNPMRFHSSACLLKHAGRWNQTKWKNYVQKGIIVGPEMKIDLPFTVIDKKEI